MRRWRSPGTNLRQGRAAAAPTGRATSATLRVGKRHVRAGGTIPLRDPGSKEAGARTRARAAGFSSGVDHGRRRRPHKGSSRACTAAGRGEETLAGPAAARGPATAGLHGGRCGQGCGGPAAAWTWWADGDAGVDGVDTACVCGGS